MNISLFVMNCRVLKPAPSSIRERYYYYYYYDYHHHRRHHPRRRHQLIDMIFTKMLIQLRATLST